MPIAWALANPKIDEREVSAAMLDREPHLAADRPGLLLIADKGFASEEFETDLAFRGVELLRPSCKREKPRPGESLLKSVRQPIESVNDTLKGQLDLEQHGEWTFEGVAVRVCPAHPRDGLGHLAEPQDRTPRPAVADRIRPLNTSQLLV